MYQFCNKGEEAVFFFKILIFKIIHLTGTIMKLLDDLLGYFFRVKFREVMLSSPCPYSRQSFPCPSCLRRRMRKGD